MKGVPRFYEEKSTEKSLFEGLTLPERGDIIGQATKQNPKIAFYKMTFQRQKSKIGTIGEVNAEQWTRIIVEYHRRMRQNGW